MMRFLAICLITFISAGCEQAYVPKPRGFQRIIFPEKQYNRFVSGCNFSCEIPAYAKAEKDRYMPDEKCWFNIQYQPFNATLHLSYVPIASKDELFKVVEDSRTLVYKHTIKADEIYETLIGNEHLNGMLYELSGNTATNFQFYVTDSSKHYIRGALYFNERTNLDSIQPSLNYLKSEILHMLETLSWD